MCVIILLCTFVHPQVDAFVKGMTDGGVMLEEPETYSYRTKPDDYFPTYLGKDHHKEIEQVCKERDETRDSEFKHYDERVQQKLD